MRSRRPILALALAFAGVAGAAFLASAQDEGAARPEGIIKPAQEAAPAMGADDALRNDYPTNTRADYIFGCMQVNGQTRIELDKCACSIDVISSVLPYQDYEEAETILSVRQRGGENVGFLFNPAMREKVNNLKRAQIEGELRCF
ncbi:MAG TPA: hypothetical protein VJ045_01525 [Hyphomicrobiaceae bacterium]|nr:hypothetical protein [Hyphomicrobiaceae bacterium]